MSTSDDRYDVPQRAGVLTRRHTYHQAAYYEHPSHIPLIERAYEL